MRFILFVFLLAFFGFSKAYAQGDSASSSNKPALNPVDPKTVNPFLPDSVVEANRKKLMADSASMGYLIPDSSKMNDAALDSILKTGANTPVFLPVSASKSTVRGKSGTIRTSRDSWVIAVLIGLLIYTGLLNLFFGAELKSLALSFYNKRSLSPADKEQGLVNSWAFAALFLLFCLTLGLILYQLTGFYKKTYPVAGFNLYLSFAGIVGALVALKYILLKIIGFIFDITGVVSGYLGVLNLTYFSLSFVLLAAAICFSLLANQFVPQLLIILLSLIGIVLVWQYLRSSVNIISNFRFHKFYLFVYLCALEICPVLILIKALNI